MDCAQLSSMAGEKKDIAAAIGALRAQVNIVQIAATSTPITFFNVL